MPNIKIVRKGDHIEPADGVQFTVVAPAVTRSMNSHPSVLLAFAGATTSAVAGEAVNSIF